MRKTIQTFRYRTGTLLTFCLALAACGPSLADTAPPGSPALNPPRVEKSETGPSSRPETAKDSIREWTYHKSGDGAHPNGYEQQMLWLINRARVNPTQEGEWLAAATDPDVVGGRDYFGVNLTMLRSEFAAIAAKPPAAFDIRLYNAACAHSLDLIARNAQDHLHQFDRVDAAGFHYSWIRGNVFAYADSGLNAHAAFNIDWGGSEGGMQTGRGHRQAIMAMDGNYTNVGLAAVAENNPVTAVGPLVVTGNFAQANTSYSNHYNIFIVGTVWQDTNSSGSYEPGEGVGGVSVAPDGGAYYAVTGDSGGYAIPADNGTYTLTFSGGALNGSETMVVTVDGKSVLADLLLSPVAVIDRGYFPWLMFLPTITRQQ